MDVKDKDPLTLFLIILLVTKSIAQLKERHPCEAGPIDLSEERHCPNGYALRCNRSGLNDVPKFIPMYHNSSLLCVLDLSQNNISLIKNLSFVDVSELKMLLLSDNRIKRIDSDAFVNLTNLKYLSLRNNFLHSSDSFGDGVFNPLINLAYISLKNNSIKSYDWLQGYLLPLKSLKELYISGCNSCHFGEGFANLSHLQVVSLSGTYKNNDCYMPNLANNTFTYLSHIYMLYLSACCIKTVETAAFRPLKRIRHLDMSYNDELYFEGMNNVLKGLVNTSVEVLHFNHLYRNFEMGTMLQRNHVEPIQFLQSLKMIFLDLNKIEVVEEEVFELIPPSVERIGISGNRLADGEYSKFVYNMRYLKSLDLSRQHLSYDPFSHGHFEQSQTAVSNVQLNSKPKGDGYSSYIWPTTTNDTCNECRKSCARDIKCLCLPPSLENLTWTKSFLEVQVGNVKVCNPSNLKRLDVSSNLVSEWIGPIRGIETVEMLNLADNYCQRMSTFFFDSFYALRSLNVSNNFIGHIFLQANKGQDEYFKNLTKLEVLDLSENRMTTLPPKLFLNLKSLKYLNLSRNMLSKWTGTLNSKCLKILDLSENKLETLPETFRNYLDETDTLSETESCNRTGHIRVDLAHNPIQCNCETRPFLRWLYNSHVDILSSSLECYRQNGDRIILRKSNVIADTIKSLDRECFPTVSIVVSFCMFVLGVAVCITVYRHRWKLRHWYYSQYKRNRQKGYDRLFDRDAFISYANTESSFIKRFLVPALEEERGLKVWVSDRDSVPGVGLTENIVHAINFSKKTVLLFSKKYFKDSWCDYEMNMAQIESIESKRKLFVVVLLEDIVMKEIPLAYLRLLQSEQAFEYPSKAQDRNTFWDSICDAIQSE